MLTLDAAGRPTYAKPGKSASSVRAAGRVLKENPNQAVSKAAVQLPSIKGACSISSPSPRLRSRPHPIPPHQPLSLGPPRWGETGGTPHK